MVQSQERLTQKVQERRQLSVCFVILLLTMKHHRDNAFFSSRERESLEQRIDFLTMELRNCKDRKRSHRLADEILELEQDYKVITKKYYRPKDLNSKFLSI